MLKVRIGSLNIINFAALLIFIDAQNIAKILIETRSIVQGSMNDTKIYLVPLVTVSPSCQ